LRGSSMNVIAVEHSALPHSSLHIFSWDING
jgi:hypothetical protein